MSAPSLQEYVDASNAVYSHAADVPSLDPLHPELTAVLNNSLQPVVSENDAVGFYAEAYEDSQGNIIIAFEGTVPNTNAYGVGTLSTDLHLFEGAQNLAALADAARYVQTVHNEFSTANIYVTGHSLGGTEAEAAAASNPSIVLGGVTFGATGLPSNFTEAGASLSLLSNFINYIDAGDPVGNYADDASSALSTIAAFWGIGPHFGPVRVVGSGIGEPDLQQANLGNFVDELPKLLADVATLHQLYNYELDLESSLSSLPTNGPQLSSTAAAALASALASDIETSRSSTTPTSNSPKPVITGPSAATTTTTSTLISLASLFPASESPASTSNYIASYEVAFVRGPGSMIVNGQSYSLGSAIPNFSPAEFAATYFSSGSTPGTNEIAVIAFDNAGNESNEADVTISVAAPTPSPQPIITSDHTPPTIDVTSQQPTTGVAGNVTLGSSYLSVTDANSANYTPAQLTYTVVSAPSSGYLIKNGSIVSSFTQADINNGLIEYQENGTTAFGDSFTYYVSDPAGNRAANASLNLVISPPPTATHPALDTNSALTVGLGLTAVISDSNLHVTDTGLAPWQIIYHVTSSPSHGEIIADGSTQVSYFTQQQVDLRLISYQNAGRVSGSDNIGFSVTDSDGGSIGQSTFDINIVPKNNLSVTVEKPLTNDQEPDNPVIAGTNTPRAYSLVAADVLSASDPGINPQNITYTVESVPSGALGFRVGEWSSAGQFTGTAPVTTFTQAEVDAGEVFYAQSFGPTNISGQQVAVTLSASDNVGNSVSNITLPIILYPGGFLTNGQFFSGDDPTAKMTASVGQSTVVGTGILDILSPWFTSGQVKYEVETAPTDGTLYLNGVALTSNQIFNANSGNFFTQADIDNGDLTYVANSASPTPDVFSLFGTDPAYGTQNFLVINVTVSLTGAYGGQVLSGSAGSEDLAPGTGNSHLFGDGNTVADYTDSPNGVSVNIHAETVANGYGGTDSFNNIHSFVGSSAGNDTVIYEGSHSSYSYQLLGNSWFQVADMRSGAPDGTNQYEGMQFFEFSDGTFTEQQLLPPPTLSVNSDESAARSQTINLSSLVVISDPDSVGYQTLELWDSDGAAAGGQFVVNGIAQTGGHEIDVSPANVVNTVFDAGTTGGTDMLWARLLQNNGTLTAWQQFSVTVPTPTMTVHNDPTAVAGQIIPISNLVTISDPGNVGYPQLELWVTPGGGYFAINGGVQPVGQEIDVASANVANIVFDARTSAGTDVLWARLLQANGTLTSWQSFTVTVPEASLTLPTPVNPIVPGQSIPLSDLFTISDSGQVGYQKLELWDTMGTATGGRFVVNGVPQTGGHEIDVSPTNYANVFFDVGTLGGTDVVWGRLLETDGTTTAWQAYTLTAPKLSLPTLSVTSDGSATRGQTLALASLVTISDPSIVGYQTLELWDSNGNAGTGEFVVNGVAQSGGHEIDVSPADAANTVFDVGTAGGTDTLWARLLQDDGTLTSWQRLTVTAPKASPPTLSVTGSTSATSGQTFTLSSLVTISDPNNVGYQALELWDSSGTIGGGQFVINGMAQTGGHEIDVSPSNVSNVVFDAGTMGGTDTLWAQLLQYDGTMTGWEKFSVSEATPYLTFPGFNGVTRGQPIPLSDLVTVNDPAHVGYQDLELWDSNGTPGGGQFLINGVAQTGGHTINLTTANYANTVFDVGTAGGADLIWFQLVENNGTGSGWQSVSVTTPPVALPTLAVQSNTVVSPGQSVSLSNLVTISDPNNVGYQALELWESNGTPAIGQFVVNGVAQTGGHEIDVSPANVADTEFVEGTNGNTDTLWARLL